MKNLTRKIERLKAGGTPRIMDLFSGCGGISVGLKSAGYTPIAGIDIDRLAMESWYYNLRPDILSSLRSVSGYDICDTEPAKFFETLGMKDLATQIDILCGGPPCQVYSRIGKGKLRSLSGEDAHLFDERGALFLELLRFVRELKPLAVIVENVPDSTNYGGENIPELICKDLERSGYEAKWTLLNAAEYGVPQYRQRVFILAIHNSIGVPICFPRPTNRIVRPSDRRSTKDLAESLIGRELDKGFDHYIRPNETTDCLPPSTSTEEALDDLPQIKTLQGTKPGKISQDVQTLMAYGSPFPSTSYQKIMRSWPGFETDGWVTGNAIRMTPRDFPIFTQMADGDNYPDALVIADRLFSGKIAYQEQILRRKLTRTEMALIKKATVPPYARDKFESKWTKLRRDQPSHTVVAHLQFDTYSHIHYDNYQARGISVREAARLQSFPDGFRFMGSMRDAFRQIGNAVPPLLIRAIGKTLLQSLRKPGVGHHNGKVRHTSQKKKALTLVPSKSGNSRH